MNNQKYIILGLTPQGLALLRELGKAGADVTAFCSSKRNVGYHSRYGEKICYHNMAELKQYITQIVADHKAKPICYITSGEILASILREYKELYDGLADGKPQPRSLDKAVKFSKTFKNMRNILLGKSFAGVRHIKAQDSAYPLISHRNRTLRSVFASITEEIGENLCQPILFRMDHTSDRRQMANQIDTIR